MLGFRRVSAGRTNLTRSYDFDPTYGSGNGSVLDMSAPDFGAFDKSKFAIVMSFRRDVLATQYLMYYGEAIPSIYLYLTNDSKLNVEVLQGVNQVNKQCLGAPFSINLAYDIMIHFDLMNNTNTDRIKMFRAAPDATMLQLEMDTLSFPSKAPITAQQDSITHKMMYGNCHQSYTTNKGHNGLISDPVFFSGYLPSIDDVYDQSTKQRKDVSGITGLFSKLTTENNGSIVDQISGETWNNYGVTLSSTVI